MASSRTALFFIDIQNYLASCPYTEIPHATRIKDVGRLILADARDIENRPLIVFVQHEDSLDEGPLVKGTEPWKLVFTPNLHEGNEILVAKKTRDTFGSNPALADELRAYGTTDIVVIGVQSECCVEATCKGGLAAGFQVTLLQNAHSTYDTTDKSALQLEMETEEVLRVLGVKLMPWTEFIEAEERF